MKIVFSDQEAIEVMKTIDIVFDTVYKVADNGSLRLRILDMAVDFHNGKSMFFDKVHVTQTRTSVKFEIQPESVTTALRIAASLLASSRPMRRIVAAELKLMGLIYRDCQQAMRPPVEVEVNQPANNWVNEIGTTQVRDFLKGCQSYGLFCDWATPLLNPVLPHNPEKFDFEIDKMGYEYIDHAQDLGVTITEREGRTAARLYLLIKHGHIQAISDVYARLEEFENKNQEH